MSGVVVLGSANVDFVVEVERRPEPGETVLGSGHRAGGGGKGANQAYAAARAGAATALLARVGRDVWAAQALDGLDEVDTARVQALADVPTGAAFISVTPDGENSIVVSPGANARVDAAFVEAAADLIRGADVLCTVLEIPLDAVRRGCELAREGGARVVLTPAPALPAAVELLPLVDVVVPNAAEARALAGEPARLLELGARSAIVTRGAEGVVVLDAGGEEHIAAHVGGPVVDTTGAGDALVGTLAARLALGDPLVEAARRGVAAAGVAVTRPGAR